ncbi:MAG TPA: PepSY-associated TM helix domain-containing protein [Ramlibacter sp.]|uniref:PepSY-associated TM helix domain-containing protein n=1 Tax=Ramlibacter sp. TaxID=1917967 RepID=UPI002ED0D03E
MWLKAHRYCALTLGWLLVLAALLGAALTVAHPLDQALHPGLFARGAQNGAASCRLETVQARLLSEFGPTASYTFRPPREAADTLWVRVRGGWNGTVYVDPSDCRERGRRGEREGFYNLLFELHSALLLGERGQAVLTTAAATYLALLLSGLVLWWPNRWPPRLQVRWSAGALRSVFDLHGLGGAFLGLFLAVAVATGAYMSWPPLRPFVSSLAGERPAPAPVVPRAAAAASAMPLDQLVRIAQARWPQGKVGSVISGGDTARPVRVRLKLPDDPHPVGLSSVWLHPATGEVLALQRWDQLDLGHKAISVIYPLHTGDLGGPLHAVLVGLLGLALAGLGGSGLWLWWRRRPATSRNWMRPNSRPLER